MHGASKKADAAWEHDRGKRLAALVKDGRCCDVVLVVGKTQARIPAVRALLAASSVDLAIRLEALPEGDQVEFCLPEITPAAARTILEYVCGVPPSETCLDNELRDAARALGITSLEGWSRIPETAGNADAPALKLQKSQASVAQLFILVFLVSVSAYLPGTQYNLERGGFFMDDTMIKRNPNVVEPLDWWRLLRTDYWGLEMFEAGTWTHKSYRPLAVLTFRLNYVLHGFDSIGWHLTNILFHCVASGLVGVASSQALQLPWTWSLILAALFGVHPVHTENVLYIVGRADIICWIFVLLAILVYAPCVSACAWQAPRLLSAVVLIVLAGLCKETGFTFFGLLVGWEVLRGLQNDVFSGTKLARSLRVVSLLIMGGGACCIRMWYTSGTDIENMDPHSNPIAVTEDSFVRKLSYALVHGMYGQLLAWPSFLNYDYSMDAVPLVYTTFDVRLSLAYAVYLATAGLLCFAMQGVRRRSTGKLSCIRNEGPLLGLAILLLSFLPMSNILFPVGTFIGERLLYMPSAGALVLVVSVACNAAPYQHRRIQLVLVVVGAVWWVLCFRRVLEWKDLETITVTDGLRQLRSTRTQFNLANVYLKTQRYEEALVAYRRAITVDPLERDSLPLYHAGQILFFRQQYAEAEVYLHKAVSGYYSPLTVKEEEIFHDYGLILWHTGKGQEAVANLLKALQINPAFGKAANNLACTCLFMYLRGMAGVEFARHSRGAIEQAIAADAGSMLYWRNAAAILQFIGEYEAAESAWMNVRQADAGAEPAPPQDCTWEFYFR